MKSNKFNLAILIATLLFLALDIALLLPKLPISPIRLERIASGLDAPLGVVDPGDGSGRLFIVDKLGAIYILQGGEVLSRPFLDLRDRVHSTAERGLLGLAFDPDFARNGLFYATYVNTDDETILARYQISSDPDAADPHTEEILIRFKQPTGNHNGAGCGTYVEGNKSYKITRDDGIPTLEEMLAQITDGTIHKAVDWSGPVGNEIW